MRTCARCHWKYPDNLVTDFMGVWERMQVCGICALALTNEIHGTTMTTFHGEQAEAMRLDAIAYRQTRAGE